MAASSLILDALQLFSGRHQSLKQDENASTNHGRNSRASPLCLLSKVFLEVAITNHTEVLALHPLVAFQPGEVPKAARDQSSKGAISRGSRITRPFLSARNIRPIS
jgi:hypothetical protein